MSQMPRSTALSRCPSCEEPLESGDLYCGACGYDLSVVPAPPSDPPTLTMNGTVPRPSSQAPPVDWPAAPPAGGPRTPAPVHLPADLPGTDVGGAEPPGTPAGKGVRFDRPAEPDDYHLASPGLSASPPLSASLEQGDPHEQGGSPSQPVDPRTAVPSTPPAGTKVCVACRAGTVDSDGYCENCGHAQPRERDHLEQELGAVAAVSDRGLRHHRNEDAFAVSATALPDGSPAVVAIVCDGVSSATRPDDASLAAARAASEALLDALPRGTHPQQAMHDAIVAASHAVNALATEPETAQEHAPHQNAPACTLVGAVVTASLLVVGWVGDSRAYWVPVDRAAPPARLTEDDSWAAQMVATGLMSEAQAYADERAHAITGWLGADAYELDPHTALFKPDRPGVVVVCTDGLWNYAEAAEEMAEVVPLDAGLRPLHAARVLLGHALDGGGHDNVTVAVLPFPALPQGAGSA
ncbi:protein phosphatase 2C domain-containing protein [Streptomyces sp. Ru72]|uniref:protein phosphatase 2C domain-containing protein n=1 Tax=Streptomyces sp. Ru72 TaxID=2080747 RepID=UPI000CDD269D|nr:protein phosphatase 2C domain-containing protein [Streptomyces sp. Ru72]POX44644.1 serine/threonine protein phosphatase [Streptomyces sp. Ru72]